MTEMKLEAALDTIRGFWLLYWKRKVTRDFFKWWEGQGAQAEKVGSRPDLGSLEAGKIAISLANAASWWEWDGGSALYFGGGRRSSRQKCVTVYLRVLSGHHRGPKRGNEGTRTPR